MGQDAGMTDQGNGSAEIGLEVTPEALDVLRKSLELSGVDPATGGVRLRPARGLGGATSVQVEFASGPLEGESVIAREGVRLFVDPALTDAVPDPIVALEPQHERIVVRSRD